MPYLIIFPGSSTPKKRNVWVVECQKWFAEQRPDKQQELLTKVRVRMAAHPGLMQVPEAFAKACIHIRTVVPERIVAPLPIYPPSVGMPSFLKQGRYPTAVQSLLSGRTTSPLSPGPQPDRRDPFTNANVISGLPSTYVGGPSQTNRPISRQGYGSFPPQQSSPSMIGSWRQFHHAEISTPTPLTPVAIPNHPDNGRHASPPSLAKAMTQQQMLAYNRGRLV